MRYSWTSMLDYTAYECPNRSRIPDHLVQFVVACLSGQSILPIFMQYGLKNRLMMYDWREGSPSKP